MTLLKFSTSALKLTTSVGDIDDLTPDREPVPEPEHSGVDYKGEAKKKKREKEKKTA